jgi:hypothetical protein
VCMRSLSILSSLEDIRRRVERAFDVDTAAPGFPGSVPSSGHCAAVAAIVHELLGGELVSTRLEGQSHWLNRLTADGRTIDADLTGDQFGLPAVQIGDPGRLYRGLRVRPASDLSLETLARAALLARRAGLDAVSEALRRRRDGGMQRTANS